MFRISFLLWVVVLAAFNFVVLRHFKQLENAGNQVMILIGLMPLFDLFILASYLAVTKRYRFSLVECDVPRRLTPLIAAWSGGFLLLGTMLCLVATEGILHLIEFFFTPILPAVEAAHLQPDLQESLAGGLLGLLMSGPPILLALLLAYIGSSYRLVVTPRDTGQD